MSKLGTTALLLVVAISASDAQACGEVMYRMGGALRYHAFITRHPAEILLYNGTAAQQAATADSQRFHENLEKAGQGHGCRWSGGAHEGSRGALVRRHHHLCRRPAGDQRTDRTCIARTGADPGISAQRSGSHAQTIPACAQRRRKSQPVPEDDRTDDEVAGNMTCTMAGGKVPAMRRFAAVWRRQSSSCRVRVM